MKIIDYMAIEELDIKILNKSVCDLITEGRQPLWGMVFQTYEAPNDFRKWMYTQAMVKYEPDQTYPKPDLRMSW